MWLGFGREGSRRIERFDAAELILGLAGMLAAGAKNGDGCGWWQAPVGYTSRARFAPFAYSVELAFGGRPQKQPLGRTGGRGKWGVKVQVRARAGGSFEVGRNRKPTYARP